MTRKKVGILTINARLMNYGSRLQNYALQEAVKKLGYEVRTVDYTPVYPPRNASALMASARFIVRAVRGAARRSARLAFYIYRAAEYGGRPFG